MARKKLRIKKTSTAITVTNDDPSFLIHRKAVLQIASNALRTLRFHPTHLSLVFTSDLKMKRLNRRFLGHNRTTDVLAFSGEVIISPKRAEVQAPLYESSFREELARYICHGILHLAGLRDKTQKQKKQMRNQEDRILELSTKSIQRLI